MNHGRVGLKCAFVSVAVSDLAWENFLIRAALLRGQISKLLLQLAANLFQRQPARVFHLLHAGALFNIQVLAAVRA